LEELVVCPYPRIHAASKSPSQALMNFILCDYFGNEMRPLHAIFKAKDGSKSCTLADEHVDRARKIISPFLLRRLKKQVGMLLTSQRTKLIVDHKVEKDLPNKKERIEWCELTECQRHIYNISL
jgi:SWI/SNF-related matrix-associated actin-dependent regulator of chromatin subfamily A containing DEAD/H box 1